jgi:hypothetical protein
MNDLPHREPQAAAASDTAPAQAPSPPPAALAFTRVKVVDARPPNAPLATLPLNALPRPGDLITIDLAGRRVLYRVDFVNFNPYDNDAQVTLGCSPNQPAPAGVQTDPAKVAEYIQRQEQIFQKLEAYSKTIIVLGYAGLFALWGFVKDHLSHRAIVWTAALVGSSLIVYIAWEVGLMVQRALFQHRFNQALKANPADWAKAINDFVEQTRAAEIRGTGWWLVILIFTVVPGFAGALILLYNVFAELIGLRAWP